jgi:gallate decarboxylase subunit D
VLNRISSLIQIHKIVNGKAVAGVSDSIVWSGIRLKRQHWEASPGSVRGPADGGASVQVEETGEGLRFRTEEGRYDLEASARWIGGDLLVAIWGGEQPHVGAVALAEPRPSLKDAETTSATASVLCVVGHKEDSVVKMASEFLSAALGARVVVTAGMHWDRLDEEGIRTVVRRVDSLVRLMARTLEEGSKPAPRKG